MLKRRKWTVWLAGAAGLAVVAAGCNLFADESQTPPQTKEKHAKKETAKPLSFTRIEWSNGLPAPQKSGGVYLFTKQNHPLEMAYAFQWNRHDALLVQVNSPHFRGYSLDVMAIEQLDADRIRIKVRLIPGEKAGGPKAPPASGYAELERGLIQRQDMTFLVVDEKGEEVPLN